LALVVEKEGSHLRECNTGDETIANRIKLLGGGALVVRPIHLPHIAKIHHCATRQVALMRIVRAREVPEIPLDEDSHIDKDNAIVSEKLDELGKDAAAFAPEEEATRVINSECLIEATYHTDQLHAFELLYDARL